jgi:hypothetical protein
MRTRRTRTQSGLTMLEVAVSAALAAGVLTGATYMLDASRRVAQSTNDVGDAAKRADLVLEQLADAIRRGSLASMRKLNGTNFSSGQSDVGLQLRFVTGYVGTPTVSDLVTYRWDRAVGATEGELVRADGAVDTVVARHVTDFSVARAGDLFTLTVAARSGPTDDRGRVARGSCQITARNP